jgi:hypothetical protein
MRSETIANVAIVDSYVDPFSKIALTLTASQLAKDLIVQTEGIGEDLAFNFFAWRYDKPFLCAQLESSLMKEDHSQRFSRCYELMKILRLRLGVSSLTFIAEGYVAKSPQKKELSLAFLEPSSGVKECLTVIHCEENKPSRSPDVYLFSMPYEYANGRAVRWGHLTEFSQNAINTIRRYSYPAMLHGAFRREIDDETATASLTDEIAYAIVEQGFLIQEF